MQPKEAVLTDSANEYTPVPIHRPSSGSVTLFSRPATGTMKLEPMPVLQRNLLTHVRLKQLKEQEIVVLFPLVFKVPNMLCELISGL